MKLLLALAFLAQAGQVVSLARASAAKSPAALSAASKIDLYFGLPGSAVTAVHEPRVTAQEMHAAVRESLHGPNPAARAAVRQALSEAVMRMNAEFRIAGGDPLVVKKLGALSRITLNFDNGRVESR